MSGQKDKKTAKSSSEAVVYHTPFPLTGEQVEASGRTYTTASKQDFMKFRNYADSLDGFTLKYETNEVLVWDKKIKGESLNLIKLFGVFKDTTPSHLYDMLQDPVYRCKWDEHRMEAFCITLLNHKNDIGYYAAKAPTGLSNRDFVNQRMWHSAGNGEYVIFNTSVPHADMPPKKGFVRAISKVSGYLIRPWGTEKTADGESKSCCLTYITQTDPAGWIPTVVVNYVTTKYAPNTYTTVASASAGFKEWFDKQTDYTKNWDEEPDAYDEPIKHETIEFAKSKWNVK